MRMVMVVPTYWSRPSHEEWQEGDLVFDHPTPRDGIDTLGRFLRSMSVLDEQPSELVVIAVPTAADIESRVVERVKKIVAEQAMQIPAYLLCPSHLEKILLELGENSGQYQSLLSLSGYPHVRNACLIAGRLLRADVVVLIDDDEVFEDPYFIKKVREGVGREHQGKKILSLAGYYLNPDGGYLLNKSATEWGRHWPKYEVMDDAFRQFIGRPPRYKDSPFVFGGNLSLHADLYTTLPFDTGVTRGEDIDYLMMARMYGTPTILDNTLSIKHLAPPKSHPQWQQFRQDAIRFAFQKAKLTSEPASGMIRLTPEDFDPYPGFFLRDDLDERIERTSGLLAEYYYHTGKGKAAAEASATIEIARKAGNPAINPLEAFAEQRLRWCELMEILGEERFRGILEY